MATVRMNDSHRQFLRNLAADTVKKLVDAKAMDAAYKLAVPLVRKAVETKYPPKDMEVLKKYECADVDTCVRLQLTAGGIEQFEFCDADAVYRPDTGSCRRHIYATDAATSKAVSAYLLEREKFQKLKSQKLGDYIALIDHAQTLEQIESIWPEASALRGRIGRALPVVLSDDVIARIKADSRRRA